MWLKLFGLVVYLSYFPLVATATTCFETETSQVLDSSLKIAEGINAPGDGKTAKERFQTIYSNTRAIINYLHSKHRSLLIRSSEENWSAFARDADIPLKTFQELQEFLRLNQEAGQIVADVDGHRVLMGYFQYWVGAATRSKQGLEMDESLDYFPRHLHPNLKPFLYNTTVEKLSEYERFERSHALQFSRAWQTIRANPANTAVVKQQLSVLNNLISSEHISSIQLQSIYDFVFRIGQGKDFSGNPIAIEPTAQEQAQQIATRAVARGKQLKHYLNEKDILDDL